MNKDNSLSDEKCKLTCAWKGGSPCLADDCPRRNRPSNEQFTRIPNEYIDTEKRIEVYLSEDATWLDITPWPEEGQLCGEEGVTLTVHAARKLRDWLNRALPPSETGALRCNREPHGLKPRCATYPNCGCGDVEAGAAGNATGEPQCTGNCFLIGGPFIAEDPDCPVHGRDAEIVGQP